MSALSFTVPVIMIAVAAVLFAILHSRWQRQDAFYEAHRTDWEEELERRRQQRRRAEARIRRAA